MRKTFFLVLLLAFGASSLRADEETRNRLIRFFGGWYSWFPNTAIVVKETREVDVPGYEAYRVQRRTESKAHQESNVALVDRGRDDVFIGQALHDDVRRFAKRPFDPDVDLPTIEASLTQAYGMPVKVRLDDRTRGALKPIVLSIRHVESAVVAIPGFVSEDGATLLVGEFHPLSSEAQAVRKKLIAERPGIRLGSGKFSVNEFIDFQCERCRVRAPEVKAAAVEAGGAVEVRLFPLTRVHDWAFAAAEQAAALGNVDPTLYAKFEETLFARASTMTAEAARSLASDVAEAAGVKAAYQKELSSGRARERVVDDLRLGIRLGVSGTPAFFHDGNFVSAEKELFETYLRGKVPPAARPAGQ
ncbi:MAG TPA: DsbA family protein [Thermoanaerobaculia bacterium]|nr:DsbA family protein [Thermoanaerobaculia bacterium]